MPQGQVVANIGAYVALLEAQMLLLKNRLDLLAPEVGGVDVRNGDLTLNSNKITEVKSITMDTVASVDTPLPTEVTYYSDGTDLKSKDSAGVVKTFLNSLSVIPGTTFNFAEFYALMPGDNAATVAINGPISFPTAAHASSGTTITALSATSFQLGPAGLYRVFWQVSVTEAGQTLVCRDVGTITGALGSSPFKILRTVVGRATGTSQMVGNTVIQSTTANAAISIRNGASAAALTITTIAGGTDSVSCNLFIQQLA